MNPAKITAMTTPAIKSLVKALNKRARRGLSREARTILESDPLDQLRVKKLFEDAKKRLQSTWRIGIFMTITLFVIFIGMLIIAVVTGLLTGESTYLIVFGGVSAVSILTAVLWKPYDKAFQALVSTQRLDMILIGLEQEWTACSKLVNPEEQMNCIREANSSALEEIAKVSIE
jgi:uncharacterized membrane protein YcjF (UPF0283 family)